MATVPHFPVCHLSEEKPVVSEAACQQDPFFPGLSPLVISVKASLLNMPFPKISPR